MPLMAALSVGPPRQNACRAPGLWQHVEIFFRAPRFAAGRKITNARFAKVSVNGVVVQENVQVTGPTRGAAYLDERSSGPLVVEGEHGALALRNIRYKSYTGAVDLAALRYRVYEGDVMDAAYASSHAPTREGTASTISGDVPVPQDRFAVAYDGTMTAPTPGKYRFALSLGWIGFIARLVRTSMLETMGENFIRTARAYGISERLITYKYALKNACIPTIAVLGLGIGRLLGGAVLVEIVFARPGLGRLIYDAISLRNYPVVQGAVLVVVVLFAVVNLLVDLSYSAIDPRIRRDGGSGQAA